MLLNEQQNLIRETARTFAQERLAPFAAEWDREARFPAEALREMADLGFLGMTVPEEWGGAGADTVSYSLVGPRPLLVQYLPLYNDEQNKRHDVRPGVTGWAQVKGRNAIAWPQKFEYDIWYVDNLSFFLDLKILFLTAYKVFKKEGIYSQSNTIMPVWKGNL